MSKDITSAKLRAYRAQLLERRAALEAERAQTKSDRDLVVLDQQSTGRLTRMDALQNQAMTQASEARRQAGLQKIAQALVRIEEGEFGYCAECGEVIEEKRLAFDPAISTCFTCAQG